MNQFEMICLDKMVLPNHRYREFIKVWGFENVDCLLKQVKSNNPHECYNLTRVFRCLLLQFLEDLSDRESEIFLQENNVGK